MQAWLRATPLPLPLPVTRPPEEEVDGMGVVTLAAGEAALILKDGAGGLYRVSWERAEGRPEVADRRRALPAGEYEVVGLRQVDRTRADEVWHTAATGAQLGRLVVEDGEETPVKLDATIRVTRGLRGGNMVAMNVTHPSGAGLTLYKNGRRVPVAFRLLDARGEIVRRGPMTYG